MNLSIVDQTTFIAFWLCFTRWITVVIQLPIFDQTSVPVVVKSLMSLILSFAFFPMLKNQLILEVQSVSTGFIWVLVANQALIGLIIGFLVKSILSLFVATGSIITLQIGFGSVAYFDPARAQQVGPFEKLIEWTILIMIISSGALIPMFKGVFESFFVINIFQFQRIVATPEYFSNFFVGVFRSAVLLASPLIFANLLVNLVFGIVARTVPQMNIFMVSFVVNIGIGLVLFLGIAEEFFQVGYDLYVKELGVWFQFVTGR